MPFRWDFPVCGNWAIAAYVIGMAVLQMTFISPREPGMCMYVCMCIAVLRAHTQVVVYCSLVWLVSDDMRSTYDAFVLLFALLALSMLVALYFSDPGEVTRSRNLEPVDPIEVTTVISVVRRRSVVAVIEELTLTTQGSHDRGVRADGSSYCERCHVWRPPGSHHCR
jgi:hypothetical protein